MKRFRLVWGDLFTIIIFLLIGLGGLYLNITGRNSSEQKYLRIYVDNRMVEERSLTETMKIWSPSISAPRR